MTDSAARRGDLQAGSPWARGFSLFAAIIMMILGFLQFFQGLVAVVNGDEFYVTSPNFVFEFDVDAWGWTHLIVGAIVAAAGAFILTGSLLARGIGIFVASLSAILNFLWIPYYPWWGLALVTLNIFVIWGLTTSDLGRER